MDDTTTNNVAPDQDTAAQCDACGGNLNEDNTACMDCGSEVKEKDKTVNTAENTSEETSKTDDNVEELEDDDLFE